MAHENHWLPGFNFNVEEWDATRQTYKTLAIRRTLALARAAFAVVVEEPTSRGYRRTRRSRFCNRCQSKVGGE